MSKGYDTYTLHYMLQQSRPGTSNFLAELKAYHPIDRRLCVTFALKKIVKGQSIKRNKTCLFVSFIQPQTAVSRDTVSRWLPTVMANSGLDCNTFKTHSIRSAATSKAKGTFVPNDKLMKVADWSNTKRFGIN